MGFLLVFATGCGSNGDDPDPDFASKVAGTYSGSVTVQGVGTVPGTSKLIRSSDKVVDLEITINSNVIPLDGITVSHSGGNVYNLNLADASGSLTGKVEGNTLTYTIMGGGDTVTFSGTK